MDGVKNECDSDGPDAITTGKKIEIILRNVCGRSKLASHASAAAQWKDASIQHCLEEQATARESDAEKDGLTVNLEIENQPSPISIISSEGEVDAEDEGGDLEECSDLPKEVDLSMKEIAKGEVCGDRNNGATKENSINSQFNVYSNLALVDSAQTEADDEKESGDHVSQLQEDWKKLPRVGEEYQVENISDLKRQDPDYGTTMDELVWDPSEIVEEKIVGYLSKVGAMYSANETPIRQITSTCHRFRNEEDSLQLIRQCGYDIDEALKRHKLRPLLPVLNEFPSWTDEECTMFADGVSLYGKDFYLIHQNKLKTKSVREIVRYYYKWKKSKQLEESFNARSRLERKKDASTTDATTELLLGNSLSEKMQHQASSHVHRETSYPVLRIRNADIQHHINDQVYTKRKSSSSQHLQTSDADTSADDFLAMDELFAFDPTYKDIFKFENITPTIPSVDSTHLSLMHPLQEFKMTEPGINVGYSDAGNFAPTTHLSDRPSFVQPEANSSNDNHHVNAESRFADESGAANLSFAVNSNLFPVEPVEIPVITNTTSISPSTCITPLPPDILSSISELESTYCSPSSLPLISLESLKANSPSINASHSEHEADSFSSKRPLCLTEFGDDQCGLEAKRHRLRSVAPAVTQCSYQQHASKYLPVAAANSTSNIDRFGLTKREISQSSSNSYEPLTQLDLSMESHSEASRIVTC